LERGGRQARIAGVATIPAIIETRKTTHRHPPKLSSATEGTGQRPERPRFVLWKVQERICKFQEVDLAAVLSGAPLRKD
jgi:hypothetical protein